MSKLQHQPQCLYGEQLSLSSANTLIHAWEKTLSDNPDKAVASGVTFGEERITYASLNQLSNQLARSVARSVRAVGSNGEQQFVIALDIQPSPDLLALQLACWKLGAAKLTLDGDIPLERVKTILELSSPVIVVTDNLPGSLFEKGYLSSITPTPVHLEDLKSPSFSTSNLSKDEALVTPAEASTAVVLFTSGSTGLPKGVRLSHTNLLNRLYWQWEAMPYSIDKTTEVCLFKTTVLFVNSLTETLGPMLQLIPLVIAPKGLAKQLDNFNSLLESASVSRLILVPSLLSALLMKWEAESPPKTLTHVVCSGEALPLQLLDTFRRVMGSTVNFFNFYGSTELTGDVTAIQLTGDGSITLDGSFYKSSVSIGQPVANTNVYLLNSNFEVLQGEGSGQIAICGSNLAEFVPVPGTDYESGYRLVQDPRTGKTERCYLTGDAGVITNGNLFFVGRSDSQIKLRGHRVNLKEIEGVLDGIKGVSKAVVLFHTDLQQIIAVVKLVSDQALDEVSATAKTKLPTYMHPFLTSVDEFPLLPSTGKLNSRAMLAQAANEIKQSLWTESENALKDCPQALRDIITVVQSVLQTALIPKTGLSLSELGIDSIRTAMVLQKLSTLGYTISVVGLLDAKDIISLSENLAQSVGKEEVIEGKSSEISASKYIIMNATEFEDMDYLIERFVEWFCSRSPVDNWLEGLTPNDFRITCRGFMTVAARQTPCFSFVILDDKRKLVAMDVAMTDEELEEVEFTAASKPLVHLLQLCEEGPRRDLAEKGITKVLDDFILCTNPNLPTKEHFELVNLAHSEVARRARQEGIEAIITVNTHPVTQWHADQSGFEEKGRILIKNFEFEGRKYYTGEDIPDDYYVAGHVKYL